MEDDRVWIGWGNGGVSRDEMGSVTEMVKAEIDWGQRHWYREKFWSESVHGNRLKHVVCFFSLPSHDTEGSVGVLCLADVEK